MDLRQRKTRAAIRRAFLELRAGRDLSQITVRELAERAQVGKATFYLHYHSVHDLSRQLQREVVERIVSAVGDPADFLVEPDRVSRRLLDAFEGSQGLVDVLFSGEQAAVLGWSIEEAVRSRMRAGTGATALGDARTSALLTFAIQGGYYAYLRSVRGAGERGDGGADGTGEAADPALREEVVAAVAEASRAVVALVGGRPA